jgi:4,5-DOPA dioxygenase extradiol
MTLMPAAFIGHGNPANARSDNRFTRSWKQLGADIPKPRAILVVSAHWLTMHTIVTAMPRPRTIHDHWGPMSPGLIDIEYPAPGAPDVAAEITEIAKPDMVLHDVKSWGLDHATWAVLTHMYPDADIPVLQLSHNLLMSNEEHFDLGTRLAPLREQGVLILGSGNIVHNLPIVDPSRPEHGHDWAHRFDAAARDQLTATPDNVLTLQEHPDYQVAVPTIEHIAPMLYLAGLAAASGQKPEMIVDGCVYSTMSMTRTASAWTGPQPRPDHPFGIASTKARRRRGHPSALAGDRPDQNLQPPSNRWQREYLGTRQDFIRLVES